MRFEVKRSGSFRIQLALATWLLWPLAAQAGGLDGLLGISREANDRPTGPLPAVRVDDSVRRAAPGTENIVALLGGSPDGSREERFTRNLQQQVGGTYLHGDYDLDDLVGTMLPQDRATRPISNLYFTGHITGRHRSVFPELPQALPDQPVVAVLETGSGANDRVLNANNQFFSRYDTRMRELGLEPTDVWAPNSQIVFKNCNAASMTRPFIDQLADRVPESTTIEAYTGEYDWNTFTRYNLGWNKTTDRFLDWRTEGVHNLGRQQRGLTLIRGRWRPGMEVGDVASAGATTATTVGLESGASERPVTLSD